MPSRWIREGILTSERVEQLDAPAEVFYRRLLNKVDDFGLFDGRLSILRSTLYPLRLDRVREADISRWMAACQKAGLIVLYEADGRSYLKVLDTRWPVRTEPKFPPPTNDQLADANNCKQVLAQPDIDIDCICTTTKSIRSSKARGTLNELQEFAVGLGLSQLDGEACFHKWEGNGWKNDGKPILDWKATMRSWKAHGYLASQKNQQSAKKSYSGPEVPI